MAYLLRPCLLVALFLAGLPAEDGPDPAPVRPGAIGRPTARLEFLGRGQYPTARVIISNPGPGRLHLSRGWTYEVIPQASVENRSGMSMTTFDDDRPLAFADLASAPNARVWIRLPERTIFRGGASRRIAIEAGRSWGQDHPLDLRKSRLPPGIIFVRLAIDIIRPDGAGNEAEDDGGGEDAPPAKADDLGQVCSDWIRMRLPDVPDLPLVRFGPDARKLEGEVPFARAAKGMTVFTATAASGEYPWTRVLTLVKGDPLAAELPRLLLDGKSVHVVPDGEPYRYAVSGIDGPVVDSDAEVIAVQTAR